VSVFMGPWVFDYREESLGRPLMYEGAVRIFILTTLALFLVGWLALIHSSVNFWASASLAGHGKCLLASLLPPPPSTR